MNLIELKKRIIMNELCKIKGHMWYTSERKDVKKKDGIYSVPVKIECARCGEIKKIMNEVPTIKNCNNCKFIKTCESGIFIDKQKKLWLRSIVGVFCNEFEPKEELLYFCKDCNYEEHCLKDDCNPSYFKERKVVERE
jgi:hypothetical protein